MSDSNETINTLKPKDITYFGKKYLNWQGMDAKHLLSYLDEKKFHYILHLNGDEVDGVHLTGTGRDYGFPGRVSLHMEDEWTYFYQSGALTFYFKSEKDKVTAILLK